MSWKRSVVLCALLCSVLSSPAAAQNWSPTDIGAVGVPGRATPDGHGAWTVEGSGADIWGAADSFQFVQGDATYRSFVIVRVDDLQNTNAFAKAGIMLRSGLDADSATFIVDVKPDGFVELMHRQNKGGSMEYLNGKQMTFPVWLQLNWEGGNANALVSEDGDNWFEIGGGSITVSYPAKTGLAVTSHDNSRLATAHFSHVHFEDISTPEWRTRDVGAVGLTGKAVEQGGEWEVQGAGADIWGYADAFRYLYHTTRGDGQHLLVRVDDLTNTSSFAKAGLMLRSRLDADAETVILDVRPTGDVEFMQRASTGSAMQYLSGAHVTLPAWLQLEFHGAPGPNSVTTVTASVSQDRMHWQSVGDPVSFAMPLFWEAGLAVTSHDASHLATAHVAGLSLIDSSLWVDDIGVTGSTGNAVIDPVSGRGLRMVEGAGADIWGTADSFTFLHGGPESNATGTIFDRTTLLASHPYAKAGVMYRDGLSADAPSVILDVRPGGGIEFMARLCRGCETTFIAGGQLGSSPWLSIFRNSDGTFSAIAMSGDLRQRLELGSVSVPMSTPIPGFAVTSHDVTQTAIGAFDDPPR